MTNTNDNIQQRDITTVVLPVSKINASFYAYMKAKEMFELSKAEDTVKFMIEKFVVSIDGNDDDIFNRAMDLRAEDYKFLQDEMSRVLMEPIQQKKA